MIKHFIYCLEKNGVPFYIGRTISPKTRMYFHIKKYGADITYEILDEITSDDYYFWENYYLFLYRSWGFEIVNKKLGIREFKTIIKTKNIGQELSIEINDKGYSKNTIAKLLSMSYNTLIKRLNDGEFTQSEHRKLLENRYINE